METGDATRADHDRRGVPAWLAAVVVFVALIAGVVVVLLVRAGDDGDGTASTTMPPASATELVHIGQAVMGCGGKVDYLVDTVLNYPTLSEAYKVAALDVTNKLRALGRLTAIDA